MERFTGLSQKDRELSVEYGGTDIDEEADFKKNGDTHYSDRGGHFLRSIENKNVIREGVKLGLVAVAYMVSGCVPAGTEAYTTPFGIVYNTDNPSPELIAHEEAHFQRAQKEGLKFWLGYTFDPEFRCEEEIRANSIAGYDNPKNHPYCEGIK